MQTFNKLRHIFMRIEAQAMHTGIELDMDRHITYTFALGSLNQFFQYAETIDIRFQTIVEHSAESRFFRVHYNYRTSNARFSQVGTLVGNGYRQIIHLMVLQSLGYFQRSGTVSRRLDHTYQLSLWLQLITIIVQVIYQRIQIDRQYSLVHLQLQQISDSIEVESTRSLNQHHLITQSFEHIRCQQLFSCGEELLFFHLKTRCLLGYFFSHPDNAVYATAMHQVSHLTVKQARRLSAFKNIRENQSTLTSLVFRTTHHKVESYIERSIIRVITIVYQHTSVLTLFHLHTHGHRFQMSHPLGDFFRRNHQIKSYSQTVQRVLYRSVVNERNSIFLKETKIAILNCSACIVFGNTFYKQRTLIVFLRPSNFARSEERLHYATAYQLIVTIIYNDIAVFKELQFLHTLFLQRREILLMRSAYVGKHTYSRTNYRLQRFHLALFRDTCLKYAKLGMLVHEPY